VTPSYNLVDEPFVPCLTADGTAAELGLRDCLGRAHELRELWDGSPLVTAALHRLLLAVLHRVFGPPDLPEWKNLWAAGRFAPARLDDYWRRWRGRFDLFHPDHPFYQTAGLVTQNPLPASALFEELAGGNNATLFDHTVSDPPAAAPASRAARGLVARQQYALGLGISPACTVRGKQVPQGNRKDGPMARGMVLLVRGENLFQTLLLNLTAYQPSSADVPAWERDDPEAVVRTDQPYGRVDLLTWQSRRLLLGPPDASLAVTRVHFVQGRDLSKDAVDGMKPYVASDDRGWVPLPMSEGRAVWRDSSTLFALARRAERPAEALNWVARAMKEGTLPRRARYVLSIFGVCYQPGKATSVELWRHDRLPLQVEYLDDVDLVEDLRRGLEVAERVGAALRDAVRDMAAAMLAPGGGHADRKRVDGVVAELAPERAYWSTLEVPFRRFLDALAGAADPDAVVRDWVCHELTGRAWAAFDRTAGHLDGSARLLRAVTRGRHRLARGLAAATAAFREGSHEHAG
jgi:CRISPR system Cascade subunit CasA